MTDIVERLRDRNNPENRWKMMTEAADEIERLRAVNAGNIDFAEQAKAHLNDARNYVATLRAELREAGLLR